MKFKYKLGFIGFGNMSTSILSGILKSNILHKEDIAVCDHSEIAKSNAQKFDIFFTNSNLELVQKSEFVFFAVKPQAFEEVAKEIGNGFVSKNKIISILAGTKISEFQKHFKDIPIARAMPNMPALIKCGMSGVDVSNLKKNDAKFVLNIFNCIGETIKIDESQINDVVAISGSGPAYVYLFIKGVFEKAKSLGFSDQVAKKLVVSTFVGSAKMFEKTDDDIDVLIDRVCSRGGTTIEAVKIFQDDGLINLIDKAISACYNRAVELSEDIN